MAIQSPAPAFFRLDGDNGYIGHDPARGPWAADACHAGPVTGAIARSFEHLVTDKQLTKLSVEILRPVPLSGFYVEATIRKQGRMVTTASAKIVDKSGKLIASANSLHIQVQSLRAMTSVDEVMPAFELAEPGDFPIKSTAHGLPSFSSGIEVRYPPGEDDRPGPTLLWMRTLPLIENEIPSPFQSLCPLADCGNGLSRNEELSDLSFMNPDITIVMHRAPKGEWLGSKSQSHWQSTGIGLAQATLFDQQGAIGSAMQTLLLQELS
ncbi:MAG: thioesterase family protein [Cellvibrionaceae bacterium]